jgi:uncharacterized protein (DUF1697 family)
MTAYVALFRGINVGGRVIKMDDLKTMYRTLGFGDVITYIQSGNVVFSSDETDEARIRRRIEEGFEQTFGYHVDVIIRSADELQAIIAKNPFQDQPDKASNWVVVSFMAAPPDEAAQAELRKSYAGPEEIFILGRDVYIYYPNGIGRSKLTLSLIEKKLKTVGTARNLNTILQLRKLVEPIARSQS